MNASLKKLLARTASWRAPLLLVALAALAYLPMAAQFGVYRDGWHIIRTGHSMEWTYLYRLYLGDRPFLGLAYMFYYRLLGEHLLWWQVTFFALAVANALAFWQILRMLWPRAQGLALTAAALFVVYPGFLQQPDAITYIMFMTSTLGALLSLALTLSALRQTGRPARILATAAALLSAAGYLLMVEFLIGFEALRLLLIWRSVEERGRDVKTRALSAGLRALPYLLLVLAFLIWRVFIFAGERPTTNLASLTTSVTAAPLQQLAAMFTNFLSGSLRISLGAWIAPPSMLSALAGAPVFLTGLLVGLLAGGLYLLVSNVPAGRGEGRPPAQAILFGLLALALTYLPIVLLGRYAAFGNPLSDSFDRYTFQSSFGAALLLAALIWLLGPRRSLARGLLAGGLIVIGVATHFYSGALFARSWQNARQYFWQLSWRAPSIEKGTLLTGAYPEGALTEGYHLSYPANLIYYPDAYYPEITGELLSDDRLYDFVMHSLIGQERRSVPMLLDYLNPLLAFLPGGDACLQVVDGRRPVLPSGTEPAVTFAAPYSRIELILTGAEPAVPPASLFGQEPARGWCYYYQKASLAMQRGDFAAAAGLGDQARAEGFSAGDPSEWLPFAEAYVYAGEYESAAPLLERIGQDDYLAFQICQLLDAGAFVPDIPNRDASAAYLNQALCAK